MSDGRSMAIGAAIVAGLFGLIFGVVLSDKS